MSLPKWVEKWQYGCDDYDHRDLIEALAIAVEALECGSRGVWGREDFKEALKRISDLGGKRA